MARLKVDDREVREMFEELKDMPEEVMATAGKFFKKETPVRSGNARSKTSTKDTTIHANYGYAARLDDGWSRQAPKGMTTPTEREIDKLVTKEIRRIGR